LKLVDPPASKLAGFAAAGASEVAAWMEVWVIFNYVQTTGFRMNFSKNRQIL
jgi:hypothetical protein